MSADLFENCFTQHVDGALTRSISNDSGPEEKMVGAIQLLMTLGSARDEITELCPLRYIVHVPENTSFNLLAELI